MNKLYAVVFLLILIPTIMFCQEISNSDNSSDNTEIGFRMPEIKTEHPRRKPRNKNTAEYAAYSAYKCTAGGIALMALSSIPMSGMIAVAGYCGASNFWLPMLWTTPLFNITAVMAMSGGLSLYIGLVKAAAAKHYTTDKYQFESGKAMRMVGAVILGTSAVPLFCAMQNVLEVCGVPVILGCHDYLIDIIWSVFNFMIMAVHIAVGAPLLSVGCYKVVKFLDKYTPEVSMTTDAVSVGLRMRI